MNPEILGIDQDPLGAQGRKHGSNPGLWVLVKPMTDASAVSICQHDPPPASPSLRLARCRHRPAGHDHRRLGLSPIEPTDTLHVRLGPYESKAYVCRTAPPPPTE